LEGMRTLLADCLRESANGYVVDALLNKYPNVSELMNANEKEITSIKGIGVVKAKQLSAILEFARKIYTPDKNKRIFIKSPKDVYDLVRADMEFLQVEHFDVIGLSTKNHVIFKENISIGSLNASIVHPREAFKGLIRRSCAACIFVTTIQVQIRCRVMKIILLTKKLVECGKLIGIEVLDHVIVGATGGGYISLKEQGKM